jgi:hypothetical protein
MVTAARLPPLTTLYSFSPPLAGARADDTNTSDEKGRLWGWKNEKSCMRADR